MNKYKINYVLEDGTRGVMIVDAANKMAALETFGEIAYNSSDCLVIAAEAFRLI